MYFQVHTQRALYFSAQLVDGEVPKGYKRHLYQGLYILQHLLIPIFANINSLIMTNNLMYIF